VVGRGFVEELEEEGCCCLAVYLCGGGFHNGWIDGSSYSDNFSFFLVFKMLVISWLAHR
jgi:hypothetical protein